MIRQTITPCRVEGMKGHTVETIGDGRRRALWTAGSKREAEQEAKRERIEMCRIMADEAGG